MREKLALSVALQKGWKASVWRKDSILCEIKLAFL